MVRIFALEFGWGSALWWWLGSSLVDLFEWLDLLEVVGIFPDSRWLGSWLVTISINYLFNLFCTECGIMGMSVFRSLQQIEKLSARGASNARFFNRLKI